MTCEPDVTEWQLTPDDCFLVLATDGLWDVTSNELVAQMVMNAEDPKWVAKQLCDVAWRNGSSDNISVIVVDLRDHGLLSKRRPITNGTAASSATSSSTSRTTSRGTDSGNKDE